MSQKGLCISFDMIKLGEENTHRIYRQLNKNTANNIGDKL
jgi:hypothetical protein